MTDLGILSGVAQTLGEDMLEKIQSSKILLVGAGGIGCELLKNLALSGFSNVKVIDLDTIDVSNLNRQLLFRSQHVGMPKCTVGAKVAADMAPTKVEYTAMHGNVCDNTQFNIPFVKEFDLVLNALDNITARQRVNRLCLAAKVPLVEAGTTGYLGQVNVIGEGTACYECKTQQKPKVYPICTIRSTPSMPVHTIVWAKEFYKILFSEKVEESMLFEDTEGEDKSSIFMESVMTARQLLEDLRQSKPVEKDTIAASAKTLIVKMYTEEIQKQLDMDRFKTARKTPTVLSLEQVDEGMASQAPTQSDTYSQMDVWSASQCVAELVACIQDACADPKLVLPAFDKDDDLSMRFVTAASNLRSIVFGIEPLQSFYSAKGIAGNIIPAIATTNAICAGLQILQAFEILKAQMKGQGDKLGERCSYINCIRNKTRNGLLLTAAELEKPNPNCFVCRDAVVPLHLKLSEWTFEDLLNKIIKKDLGFEEPCVTFQGAICIWEEGEDGCMINLPKKLQDLPRGGIQNGTVLSIDDFSQDLEISICIMNQEEWEADEEGGEVDGHKFVLGGAAKKAVKAEESKEASTSNNDDEDDDDDIVCMDDEEEDGKRKATDTTGEEPSTKKARVDDVIKIL